MVKFHAVWLVVLTGIAAILPVITIDLDKAQFGPAEPVSSKDIVQ